MGPNRTRSANRTDISRQTQKWGDCQCSTAPKMALISFIVEQWFSSKFLQELHDRHKFLETQLAKSIDFWNESLTIDQLRTKISRSNKESIKLGALEGTDQSFLKI